MHMTSTNRSHSELDEAPAGGSSREQAHGGLRDADTTKRFRTVPRLGRRGEGRGREMRGWAMHRGGVARLLVAFAICGSLVASGCGGSKHAGAGGSPGVPQGASGGGVVASVAGRAITKATLEHWIPIEAVISEVAFPHAPVPLGLVPDPPAYSACISYRRSKAVAAGGAVPSIVTVKRECEARYQQVRSHMLQILISFQWLDLAAGSEGVVVTSSEVRSMFERFRREQIGDQAALRAYLKYTKETLADELLVSRADLIGTRLLKKAERKYGVKGIRRHEEEFAHLWASKTSCTRGYVIPECREYHGTAAPEGSI
jgi:hypothetical protein